MMSGHRKSDDARTILCYHEGVKSPEVGMHFHDPNRIICD